MRYQLTKLLLSLVLILGLIPSSLAINSNASANNKMQLHQTKKKAKTHKVNKPKNKKKLKKQSKNKHHRKNYMKGYITYYSHKFDGRKMANGDRYDPNIFTAAHATLPLGTKLKVTDLDNDSDNGRVLYIEVTDRMSAHTRGILDLTPRAYAYLNQKGHNLYGHLTIVSDEEFELHDMNNLETAQDLASK